MKKVNIFTFTFLWILSLSVHAQQWTGSADSLGNIGRIGNVGIGTNEPREALDLRGNLVLETGTDPFLYTGTGTGNNNRFLSILNSPDKQLASGLRAGGILVSDTYNYANPAPGFVVVKNRIGIGVPGPQSALHINGDFIIDKGSDPFFYTGTGINELNRYLSLLNSPNAATASGLKAGGILVADAYNFAYPSKNDLIVKGKIGVGTPNPSKTLDVNGDAKAQSLTLSQGIVVGSTSSAVPGTIRYANGDFQGYNGTEWVSLSASSGSNPITNSIWVPAPASGLRDGTNDPCKEACEDRGYISTADQNGYVCRVDYFGQFQYGTAINVERRKDPNVGNVYNYFYDCDGGQISPEKTLDQCHCVNSSNASGTLLQQNDAELIGDPTLNGEKSLDLRPDAERAIQIYPNPAESQLTVNVSSDMVKEGTFSLRILNHNGEVIHEEKVRKSSMQIDLSAQAAGIYKLIFDNGAEAFIRQASLIK